MDTKSLHGSEIGPASWAGSPLWLVFAWSCICTLWIWSGLWKSLGWSAFVETVEAHSVLPHGFLPLLPVLPVVEVCLGAMGLAYFPSSRPNSRAFFFPLASAVVLAVLTAYLALVPADIIRSVGCGCHGASIRASIAHFGFGSKTHFLVFNVSVLGAHLPVLVRAQIPSPSALG